MLRRLAVLLALSVVLSACATTGSAPNGWGASRTRTAPPRSSPAAPPRPAEPAPSVPVARPAPSAALLIPVAGVEAGDLRDSFTSGRSGGRTHSAIDIMAPRGTPALAITDGVVSRKHWNSLGGRTLYLTSADGRYDFYYAHLDSYADGVEIGTRVRQGDVLGAVGSTGNAQGPHLHFQVLDRSGSGRGTPVNPYDLLRQSDLASR